VCKTFCCGSPTVSSSLDTELVKGKTSRKPLAIKNTNIGREFSLPPAQSCPMAQTLAWTKHRLL
jgi:NifU-like protein involved in Fe-S cluster formation